MHVLAIPTFSRAEEFSLLLIGRSEAPFSAQEQEIAAAVDAIKASGAPAIFRVTSGSGR